MKDVSSPPGRRTGRLSMSPFRLHAVALLASLVIAGCRAEDSRQGITGVWAIDETEKVRRDDLRHGARESGENTVWDGKRVTLFGGRNEIVGFQIIIEAAGAGARSVTVEFDSLSGPGFTIRNRAKTSGALDHVGEHIELFVESYVLVDRRSDWWLASARPLPDELHMGWIPDALVPAEVRGDFQNGASGFPCDIPPASNQGIWVDVYIPRDAPPGLYTGLLHVGDSVALRRDIPVELTVHPFTLPDQTHLRNHVFWSPPIVPARHGPELNSPGYWDLFRTYAQAFHRHRLDLTDGWRTLDSFRVHLAGYYTGEYYSPAFGYDGPGAGTGNGTYSIGTYDQPGNGWRSGFYPDRPEVWQRAADGWEQWFRDNAPSVVRFKYMDDEPPYAQWPDVIQRADWIRSSSGVGRSLDILCTTRIGDAWKGHLSFFMVGGHSGWPDSGGTTGFDLRVVPDMQRLGYKVGFYNGQRPSFADPFPLDNFAADARVNPWIAWKYGADQYFLWETAYYALQDINPWSTPAAGTLLYTGQDRKFPRDDRGLSGPIMSLRVKNLRRGMQDYEYLWLAKEAGIDTREIVDRVVPHAFNDYGGSFTGQGNQPTWATSGAVFERARHELALLLSGSKGR